MKAPGLVALALILFTAAFACAQENSAPSEPASAHNPVAEKPAETAAPQPHTKFWDKQNGLLFAGVGAARALDGASTMYMRNRGVDEWLLTNDVVDNHAAFAVIEAAGTAASIGVSYLFHRTGHHKLERWVSVVHIGVATGGAIRNFTLP